MKNILLFIFLYSNLLSCSDNSVKFLEPQPVSEKSLSSFSKNIQGVYIDVKDSLDELSISANMVKTQYVLSSSCLRAEIATDITLNIDANNDREIIDYIASLGGIASIRNDTVFYTLNMVDTLFYIGNDQILKKFAGSYFLNTRIGDNYWQVRKMELNRDTLYIGEISPSDTLLRYDFVEKDSVVKDSNVVHEYLLNPDKREMRMMVKSKTFDRVEKYVKK